MDKSTASNHLSPKMNKSNKKEEQRCRSWTNILDKTANSYYFKTLS